eukprot:TRINITY_DN13419_c0_g1_i1.p1 TRINITY_DN13419_c0_g1~~TRINITY_DN13419_c0_g1_i1.p1  ORF type:complete len:420 (+),score=88.67 TRINITY_DN13419_c0_g1_i1:86-1261(+)
MGAKNGLSTKSLKKMKQGASGWKPKKVRHINDVQENVLVLILSFLTKRVGMVGYLNEDNYQFTPAATCRYWWRALEKVRMCPPNGGNSFEYLQTLIRNKISERGSRSTPSSPNITNGTPLLSPPTDLILTQIAMTPPNAPSLLHNTVSPATLEGAKEALTKFVETGGERAQVALILIRLFRLHRSILSDKYCTKAPEKGCDGDKNFNMEKRRVCELILWALNEGLVDVEAADRGSLTLLHHAARHGETKLAKSLIAAGASVTAQDSVGYIPLHYSVMNGCTELTHTLLTKEDSVLRVCLQKKDHRGLTPLEVACRYNHSLCSHAISRKQKKLLQNPTTDDFVPSLADMEETNEQTTKSKPIMKPKPKSKKVKSNYFDAVDERAMDFADRYM